MALDGTQSYPTVSQWIARLSQWVQQGKAGWKAISPNVCYWHKADIHLSSANVRFWGKSGHPFPGQLGDVRRNPPRLIAR
jgi:hypothetical protein